VEVTIEETTGYPFFAESVHLTVNPAKPVKFPLYLRIPAWCNDEVKSRIVINHEFSDKRPSAGQVVCIDRLWKPGDTVTLAMMVPLRVRKWEKSNNVSIQLGPLTFGLDIKEKYVRYGGSAKWGAFDILPDSPWNYGLEVDTETCKGIGFSVDSKVGAPPFTRDVGVKLTAKARRIPEWTLDKRGLVKEIPAGPFKNSEKLEEITLIPMGCCRLRITAFPVIDNDKGKDWPPPVKPKYNPTASHCWDSDTPDALCDDVLPKSSNDHGLDRFTWWPRKGSVEWVQYDFDKPMMISSASVYWFDDTPRGGCKLPKSWRLLYKDGKDWKPVEGASDYVVAKDKFCEVKFKEVTTPALRLEVQLEKDFSGGILEWRVK
jgi:hypothetical protein